jgi:hypothetical protein
VPPVGGGERIVVVQRVRWRHEAGSVEERP